MQLQYATNKNEDIYKQLIKKKVARKVSFLKNKKNITKQNFMSNHVFILSEMYGLNTSEVEQIFEDEISRQSHASPPIHEKSFISFGSTSQNLLTLVIILISLCFATSKVIGSH